MAKTIVLIVEDEPDLREIYETYLREKFDVRSAGSGPEALEMVNEGIDVVLLDRRMPEMSGDQVLETLRNRGYGMPVAMVTAVDPDVDIVDMPFDEYLTKPVDRDELINTVQVLSARTTFEAKSQQFFRLAAKKGSLESAPDRTDTEEYEKLLSRMTSLRAELHETIKDLYGSDIEFRDRISPDTEETQTLLSEIVDHSLPDILQELVEDYQQLKNARPLFMWKWVHRLAPQNELPCVDPGYTEKVAIDKTLIILFITLLDDTLEKHNDRATFRELSKIPIPSAESVVISDSSGSTQVASTRDETTIEHTASIDTEYVGFARRVWNTLHDRIQQAPKYELYKDLFRYDIKQAINAVEYSELAIQRPDLSTMGDLERYESHNMVMLAYADVDFMHSSIDIRNELSTLRDAVWTAQKMARIGNWVSTWERELREGDYSSGPVVYALDTEIVTHEELENSADDPELQDELIHRIKDNGIEEEFLTRWERHHFELQAYNDELTDLDLDPFIDGTEEVLRYHLASTGLK